MKRSRAVFGKRVSQGPTKWCTARAQPASLIPSRSHVNASTNPFTRGGLLLTPLAPIHTLPQAPRGDGQRGLEPFLADTGRRSTGTSWAAGGIGPGVIEGWHGDSGTGRRSAPCHPRAGRGRWPCSKKVQPPSLGRVLASRLGKRITYYNCYIYERTSRQCRPSGALAPRVLRSHAKAVIRAGVLGSPAVVPKIFAFVGELR